MHVSFFLKRRRRRYMRKQKSEAAKSSYPTKPRGLRGKEKDFRIWTFFLPFVFLLFALQKSKTKPRAMLLEFSDTCGRFPQKQSNFESPSLCGIWHFVGRSVGRLPVIFQLAPPSSSSTLGIIDHHSVGETSKRHGKIFFNKTRTFL